MKEKIMLELGDVQSTLVLPLWGRALESEKKNPLLVDKIALEIMDSIDYDFSKISKNLTEISQMGWIVRSLLIDEIIKRFLVAHPKGTIVNIGCGLDTTFERVDNGRVYWYDLDLPDVIKLRNMFIKDTERRKHISASFFDDQWLEQLFIEDNILFISAGVLYYFEENQIREFFNKIARLFPNCEIAFDATSPMGVKTANKMVLKNSGMDVNSMLKWGLKNPEIIESWNKSIKLLKEELFFRNIKNKLTLKGKIYALISDMFKMQYMVHLKVLKN